jgi:predicted polyphosphate/ATP-dependent NAD kinase
VRILVCGGRDYGNFDHVKQMLDGLLQQHKEFIIIEGGAKGADTLARTWAQNRNVIVETYVANWQQDGKAAGPIRNELMLSTGIDLVVAFPGGRGTNHMVSIAQRDSVPVLDLRNE